MTVLTPQEFCERYKIKISKLYKMTSQKKIPFLKIGNEIRLIAEEMDKEFKTEPKKINL